jgi:predicted acyltransferase
VTEPIRQPSRVEALDALRGLAILAMVLVAVQPTEGMPNWMYHAQEPPPTHAARPDIIGITWPDVVFPMFLFALGAAIPLALSRMVEAGEAAASVMKKALVRGGLLMFFAYMRQHFDASVSVLEPLWIRYAAALLAFVVLFMVFLRVPASASGGMGRALRIAGWASALVMLALVPLAGGSSFDIYRFDPILQVLAHAVVLGTLIWLAGRDSVFINVSIMLLIIGFRALAWTKEWAATVWNALPLGSPIFIGNIIYLIPVIIGIIAGEWLLAWSRDDRPEAPRGWAGSTVSATIALFVALGVIALWAGYSGMTTTAAVVVLAGMSLALWLMSRRPPLHPTEVLIRWLTVWGGFWTITGLLSTPLDGGPNRVLVTPSWLLLSGGLSVLALVILLMIVDFFRKPRAVRLLTENGQNPMIAYVGNGMIVLPILGLTTLKDTLESATSAIPLAVMRGLLLTLLVALIVRVFTRKGLVWRT